MNLQTAVSLLLLSASAPVLADKPLYLNLGGTSYHINSPYSYNEINPGLAVEIDVPGDRRFIAGAYRNSQSAPGDTKTSRIVAMEQIVYRPSQHIGMGLIAGVVDGYRYKEGGLLPMVAISTRLDAGAYALRIMYTPGIAAVTPAVISMQVIIHTGFSL